MPHAITFWVRALLAVSYGLIVPAIAHEQGSAGDAAGYGSQSAIEASAPRKIPDATVSDRDGRTLSFYRDLVHGETVAIDFIYTGCSTFCRPVTANLRAAQQQLGDRVGRDIRLISISVDPVNDTPPKLKSFAAQFEAGPGWTFVTGDKPEIDRLLAAFGVGTHGPEDHSSLTLIGNDATGRWRWIDSLAAADTIAAALRDAAAPQGETDGGGEASGEVATDDDQAKAHARIATATARYLPNLALVNQDGKTVHFYDDLVKDKIVVVDFIFTQCTDACSPLTQNLANVQQLLGDRVGRSISMVSISLDPAHDTPQVLKDFAAKFGVKPGWAFVTGPADRLNNLAHKLGGYSADWHDHSTAVVIGNVPAGQWIKINGLVAPEIIAKAVLQIAGPGG
jgi:cytochrome oxidase Cu insertion factor (SCO1/SenC/PrrC family)